MLTEIRIEGAEWGDDGVELAALKREYPTVRFRLRDKVCAHRDSLVEPLRASVTMGPSRGSPPRPGTEIVIASRAWQRDPWDPWAFDNAIVPAIERSPAAIRIQGEAVLAETVLSVITRYQRFVMRRNDASVDRRFHFVLRRHGELYDRKEPLARAAYDHALDAWAWLLRLEPQASLEVQLAVLFHDIDALINGVGRVPGRRAPPRHAREGAAASRGFPRRDQRSAGPQIADDILASCGIDDAPRARAVELIAATMRGERGSAELSLLADASALAFFSVMSPVYVSYFGHEETAEKVDATLERLRSRQRLRLGTIRFMPEIEALVLEHLERAAPRTSRTSLDAVSGA